MAESSAPIRRMGRPGNPLRPMRKHRVHRGVAAAPPGKVTPPMKWFSAAAPSWLACSSPLYGGSPPGMRQPESLARALAPGVRRPTGTKRRYPWKENMKKPLGKQDHLWYSVFAFVALVSPLDV
jgi:hypothetical protein